MMMMIKIMVMIMIIIITYFRGLRFDDEAVREALSLRLGTNLCVQHRCPCGTVADYRGTHGLSCKSSSARIARHSYLNDIIHCALVRRLPL